MSKIKIITDSGSDISWEKAEKLGIRMIPISFTFDGQTYYREGLDMKSEEFYERLCSDSTLPKTAQVTPIQFAEVYNEEYDNGYDTLIVVTISSKGSGMYQNAVLTAREVMEERGGEIIVIDSLGFTCAYGGSVVHAAKMLNEGKGKDEIVSYLEDVLASTKSYFLVDDLVHLKKGGRINTATLVLANMLDIKPVLTIKDGLVVQKDKLRGSKKIIKKLVEKVRDDGVDLSGKTIIVAYSTGEERFEELKEYLQEEFSGIKFAQIRIGAVVGCHGGPGLVGFVYSEKYDFTDYED